VEDIGHRLYSGSKIRDRSQDHRITSHIREVAKEDAGECACETLARVLIGGRERDAPRRRDDPRTPSSISTSLFDPSTSSRYLDSSLRIGLIGTWCYRYGQRRGKRLPYRLWTICVCVRASLSLKLLVRFPDPEGGGHGRYRSFRAFVISPSLSLLSLALSVVWIEKDACYPSVMLDSCSLSSWSSCLFRETHCPSRDSVISAHRSWRVVAMRD
jgi:hypothetical protein